MRDRPNLHANVIRAERDPPLIAFSVTAADFGFLGNNSNRHFFAPLHGFVFHSPNSIWPSAHRIIDSEVFLYRYFRCIMPVWND